MTQINTAIVTYYTVAIIEKNLNLEPSVFNVLRVLERTLLIKDNMTDCWPMHKSPPT